MLGMVLPNSSMWPKGSSHTSLSSRATASQLWVRIQMPSIPISSPDIKKPVTWSRPSCVAMVVLKKPVRMANSEWKVSPTRNRNSPFFRRWLCLITVSSCSNSLGRKPTGRHSSRSEQDEHSVFIGWCKVCAGINTVLYLSDFEGLGRLFAVHA